MIHNEALEAYFTEEEVKAAVWGCDSNKSPGPDGFTFDFIKTNWANMKAEVMQLMREFHERGRLVKGLNASFIVLIPKKERSTALEEFRPISLIGCIYKIIAKTLANRISKVIQAIISENQSAFIKGRQILDGIVILNELIDEAKRKKIKIVIFKVDFAKAYDTVDWDFLDEMMEGLNFSSRWRMWIRECVSTASASVLINGSPSENFEFERGIRQGDPLSPFLFLIVAEGLSLLVKKAVEIGVLEASEVGRNKVKVSHLQYADNTIFTCPAKMDNIVAIKQILRNFELVSGLKVNFHKCELLGINVDEPDLQRMADFTLSRVSKNPFSYLGICVGINHRLKRSWSALMDKVRRRLNSWSGKFLSFGGRITLIQSVLSALPTYYFSFYRIPKSVLSDLASTQRKFLWGGCEDNTKISWVKWGDVCREKNDGGLGIKDLNCFNKSLAAKWVGRILDKQDSLWVRVLKSKYGENPFEVGEARRQHGVGGSRGRGAISGWWSDICDIFWGRGVGRETGLDRSLNVGWGLGTRLDSGMMFGWERYH